MKSQIFPEEPNPKPKLALHADTIRAELFQLLLAEPTQAVRFMRLHVFL